MERMKEVVENYGEETFKNKFEEAFKEKSGSEQSSDLMDW